MLQGVEDLKSNAGNLLNRVRGDPDDGSAQVTRSTAMMQHLCVTQAAAEPMTHELCKGKEKHDLPCDHSDARFGARCGAYVILLQCCLQCFYPLPRCRHHRSLIARCCFRSVLCRCWPERLNIEVRSFSGFQASQQSARHHAEGNSESGSPIILKVVHQLTIGPPV